MRATHWLSLVAVFALVVSACTPTAPGTPAPGTPGTPAPGDPTATPAEATPAPTPDAGAPQMGGTLVFGGSALPARLDPALTSDGESFRVLQQIYEPLVTLAPGSVSELIGVLAESWTGNPDDTTYVFNLREGVTFHDGTPFNADAVVFNFNRWNTFPEEIQPQAYYINAVFGGFGDNSIIESVEATDEFTVTVTLKQPKPDFLFGIALTPFSMASPAELEANNAADPTDANTFRTNATQAGTGPFKWESHTPGQDDTLARNEAYWGDPAEGPFLDRLIIQPIADPSARLQALQAPGGVMGIDLVSPTEYEIVEADPNLTLVQRFSYNTLYVAINPTVEREGHQARPPTGADSPLADLAVRQAVAHAINKESLLAPFYGGRGSAAQIFVPPTSGWYDDLLAGVETYEFNQERARQLLADAGFGPDNKPTIEFWAPTEVTRPYMPDPQGLAQAIITMLEDVGFEVTPNSAIWNPDYLGAATTGQYDLHFLGWTGDYDDPWNWYGYHFDLRGGNPNPQFNCDPDGLRDAFTAANQAYDRASRGETFNEVVQIIHANACFVPIVHGDTALAFQPEVQGYIAAPRGSESFKGVWIRQDQ